MIQACTDGHLSCPTTCEPCTAGYYQPLAGQDKCRPVVPGAQVTTDEATSLSICPAGLFQSGGNVPLWLERVPPLNSGTTALAQAVCQACELGYAPNGGGTNSTGCVACAAGYATTWREPICTLVNGVPAKEGDVSNPLVNIAEYARVCCPSSCGDECSESTTQGDTCKPSAIMNEYMNDLTLTPAQLISKYNAGTLVSSCVTNGGSAPCVIGERSPNPAANTPSAAKVRHCVVGYFQGGRSVSKSFKFVHLQV